MTNHKATWMRFALQLLAIFLVGALPTRTLADTDPNLPLPVPTYGFNLGNTLESTWGYPTPTKAIFDTAAASGFNAVRVPCAWNFNANPETFQIDPQYMAEVKQVVDWSLAAGMHVLINIHWDGGWMENNIGETVDPIIDAKLASYWTQIATAFADYDNRLLFAGANEPNVHNPAEMATLLAYYQTFIDAVREVGGKNDDRWLVLQGGGDVAWLNVLPEDSTPNRLMVEYHNYTPSLFTIIHDDQSWGNAIYFWGDAYHYPGNPSRNATWGEEDSIDLGFQQLHDLYVKRGIPVLIGEFHAAGKSYLTGEERSYNNASSLYWNKYLLDSAQAHGLSPFYWSTPNSPFEHATGAIVDQAIVTALTGGPAPPPPNGAPYAATGLTATLNGESQINLSWNASTEATSYALYRSTDSGHASTAPFVSGITDTSYIDSDLNEGTTYYYQVVAVNNSGPSGFSPQSHATTPGTNPDPTQFSFETDPQGWSTNASRISGIETSTEQAFAGRRSLAVTFSGATAGDSELSLSDIIVPAGSTITFNLWIPEGSKVTKVEPYLQDYNWAYASNSYTSLTANAWNAITLTLPPTSVPSLKRLGLKFTTSAAWTGTCYLDSIAWDAQPPPTMPADLAAVASADEVALNWSESAAATSYKVKRSTTIGSGYTTIATTDTPSYTDTDPGDDESPYYYLVIATNASGDSLSTAAVLPTFQISLEDWRLEHFKTTENTGDAADAADPDKDGFTNIQEYLSGTDPNDSASFLSIELPKVNGNNILIRFPTVSGKTYRVERSETLLPESWTTVQENISGTGDPYEVIDANGAIPDGSFYRLVVKQ